MLLHYKHLIQQVRNTSCCRLIQQVRNTSCCRKPYHLICFQQWTPEMVMEIITSAINLKCKYTDMHGEKLELLKDSKVMILQEVNEPVLHMAVSKAASFLGAYDVNVIDHLVWEHDYNGCIFSTMADIVFVCTSTHMCIQRFAEKSSIPVLCMRSRTHASIQALATIMAIFEVFGSMQCLNLAWVGAPHPALNSYILLCPMLMANIKFKCCCKKCPVSPLLYKAGTELTKQSHTQCKQCKGLKELLMDACVVISGPTSKQKDKVMEFKVDVMDICYNTGQQWIYFHTCPRGEEVNDNLFYHRNSYTFIAFDNMKYIAAALMARAIKGFTF